MLQKASACAQLETEELTSTDFMAKLILNESPLIKADFEPGELPQTGQCKWSAAACLKFKRVPEDSPYTAQTLTIMVHNSPEILKMDLFQAIKSMQSAGIVKFDG